MSLRRGRPFGARRFDPAHCPGFFFAQGASAGEGIADMDMEYGIGLLDRFKELHLAFEIADADRIAKAKEALREHVDSPQQLLNFLTSIQRRVDASRCTTRLIRWIQDTVDHNLTAAEYLITLAGEIEVDPRQFTYDEFVEELAKGLRADAPGPTGQPKYCRPTTTKGLADIFGCSQSTIRRRIKDGKLIAKQDGRKWRVRFDQLPAEIVDKLPLK